MRKLIFFLLLFCLSADLFSQSNIAIENKIRQLEDIALKGILNADTTLLLRVWDKDFMVNTPRNAIAKNRDAVFQFQKAGLINYSSFERVIEQINIQQNLVITMGYENYVPKIDLPEGKAGSLIKRRFTNIWMKKGNDWKQIGRHASVICQ